MKITELQKIVKTAVKEAIQEEIKDILLEAVRSPKHTIVETKPTIPSTDIGKPSPMNPVMETSMSPTDKMVMRENIQNVLGGMMPGANGTISANTNSMPLQMNGSIDTASPNGKLPEGDVSMDQIMGLMNKK